MSVSRQVGSATVIALTDAEGAFFAPRTEAFPTATDAQWQAADDFDPESVTSDSRWWLRFRSFAVRDETGRTTMIDAGVGPLDSAAASWAPVPGRLPAELDDAHIDPAEVTNVVLTHLHTDHVGWAVISDGPGFRPYFPNATYVLQHAEVEAVDQLNPGLRESLLEPLRSSGQLRVVHGDTRLSPELSIVATPGHTPGHQSVLLASGDEKLAVTGDLLVHPLQLLYPQLPYQLEEDQELARHSRQQMLREIARSSGQIATPHLSEPFLPVPAPR